MTKTALPASPSITDEDLAPVSRTPRPGLAPLPYAAALALGEAVLLVSAVVLVLPLWAWLFGHVAITAVAAVVLWRTRASLSDVSPYALALIASAIAGPAGAVLSVLALQHSAREETHPERLAAWYDRIALAGDVDPVTALYNSVAMGRAVATSTTPPQMFERVMINGSLEDRQTCLGLIARQFTPSYAAALRLALVSPEPVIRVQAAAVAVKVRGELKATFANTLARSREPGLSPSQAAGFAVALKGLVGSGLLEDEDRDQGLSAVQTLIHAAASDLASGREAGSAIDAASQDLLETELLRLGHFAAFRKQRGRYLAPSAPAKDGPHV